MSIQTLAAIKATMDKHDQLRAINKDLLEACKLGLSAIKEELAASGDDDDDHPVIKSHRKTAKKMEAAIKRAEVV